MSHATKSAQAISIPCYYSLVWEGLGVNLIFGRGIPLPQCHNTTIQRFMAEQSTTYPHVCIYIYIYKIWKKKCIVWSQIRYPPTLQLLFFFLNTQNNGKNTKVERSNFGYYVLYSIQLNIVHFCRTIRVV